MKKKNETALVLLLLFVLLVAVAGCQAWKDRGNAPVPPTHVVILIDGSDSVAPDSGCNVVAGLLRRALAQDGIGEGSQLLLMRTGTPETQYEPVMAFYGQIPAQQRLLEGADAMAAAAKQFELGVLGACQKPFEPAEHSALVLGVSRAIQQLRALGCTAASNCQLFLRSDGKETQTEFFTASFKKGAAVDNVAPPVVDNMDIHVTICGLSEVQTVPAKKGSSAKKDRSTAGKPDLVVDLWKQVLSDPDSVTFEPICPRAGGTAGGAP